MNEEGIKREMAANAEKGSIMESMEDYSRELEASFRTIKEFITGYTLR